MRRPYGPPLHVDWQLCRPAQHEAFPPLPLLLADHDNHLGRPLSNRDLQMLRVWIDWGRVGGDSV